MQNNLTCFPENQILNIRDALSALPKAHREKLMAGYDLKSLENVFDDDGIMSTVEAFLKNGMNISLTARSLYMHRNTLIYKLNAIKKLTGFDLRNFDMAVTFKILHTLYVLK